MRAHLIALLLPLAACGGERIGRSRAPGGCTPNQSAECVCAPGVRGVQVCRADFTFDPCRCEGFDAGFAADAATLDANAPDARAPDAGAAEDAGVWPDASPPDAEAPDLGAEDAGVWPDARPLDVGFVDTGVHPDATVLDTGVHPDAMVPDVGFPDAMVPDVGFPDSGTITDAGTPGCTADSQCPSGRCHPLYNQCVPTNRKLHCETCNNDSECGLAADHCLSVTIAGQPAETICGQGCFRDSDCPRGYECSLSNHCYPVPGALRVHTCASLRDMFAGRACDPLLGTDQCGLPNVEDGTCVFGLGCSVGCSSTVECPSGTMCTNWFVGDFCQP